MEHLLRSKGLSAPPRRSERSIVSVKPTALGPIPVSAPDLSGNEEKYAVQAIRSSWISSTGEFISRFEAEFATYTNSSHALTVSNGTAALHLALLGLNIGPGDEVIVPSLTYVATANAVRYVGAEPVFVDIDPRTWCIDPEGVQAAITSRTKAIIPVHLYGHPADMDAISAIAEARGLWVVEDAAEAHGALYKGRPVGALGHVGTFSFYGNKILSCGEGGAITVNSSKLYARLRMLRGQGMDPANRYHFPIIGYNFRLTNVAAAILCAQLERVNCILDRRKQIYELYQDRLRHVPGLVPQPQSSVVKIAPWLFPVMVDEAKYGESRDDLMTRLDALGIETRPFFSPIHLQPPYRSNWQRCRKSNLPHTERLAAVGLNLPTFSGMSIAEVERVCLALSSVKQ